MHSNREELSTSSYEKVAPARPLFRIAQDIVADWGDRMYFGAEPYVGAMLALNKITDEYGLDSARSIVMYFLANAQTWRGETARRVKAELREMLKTNVRPLSKPGPY